MQHYSDTTDKPNVLFADSIRQLGKNTGDEASRELNASLAEATHSCSPIVFDGTIIRIELYHVRHFQAGDQVDWHRHPFTELTWVEGAPITYQHGEQMITVHDGECFFMPALTSHRWRVSAGNTVLHGFMLTVLPAADQQNSPASQLSAAAATLDYCLPVEQKAIDALRQAEEETLRGDDLGVEAAAGYLRAGLSRFFRLVAASVTTGEVPARDDLKTAPSVTLERAVAFITAHLSEPLDVSRVARHVQRSKRQLDRLFHEAFEMPVGAFILHTRLERARYLLGDSDLSIKQVAYRCGFPDPNYFTRIFRQRHGQTPGAYRQQV